jgi:hypothetical protein
MMADPGRPPFYARLLRLRHIRPGVVSCFLFLEGTLVLSGLLALAGLVSPWVVLVLPLSVAAAVKINDWVAGGMSRSRVVARPVSRQARPERLAMDQPGVERPQSRGSAVVRPSEGLPWERSGPDRPTSRDLLLEKLAADKLTSKDLER